ncbi:MAG: bifunctional folylpolyglutamate synthase/dihydrofolate synthase [Oscillospiraceae bacterium]|jgi:dihydrofolate synthase/folylpolyglutamate synthase|nr:bifunctional folylpolyglutamate synthase/dihydrofolate synthase [Oscillospiraceae bacterium]
MGGNFTQALAYVHSLERFGIQPGLERITKICAALGNPQRALRVVHVAGTNGKGSTCAMIASIAQTAGLRTGLFTSPYVIDFRERCQLNGKMIPKTDFAALTWEVKSACSAHGIAVTEFEFITALAFLYFARQNCDLVVLEVGLGGRFDATNVIETPELCVITKISLDHTQILGGTIDAIAREKSGIIKQGVPVVTSAEQPDSALEIIKSRADMCAAPLKTAKQPKILQSTLLGGDADFDGLRVHVPFLGDHMICNAAMAVLAGQMLGFSPQAIQSGIAAAKMPARQEVLRQNPLILLDGGHNEDGARALRNTFAAHIKTPCLMLCGMMADKNADAYLANLPSAVSRLIACTPNVPRAMPAADLAQRANRVFAHTHAIDSPADALAFALNLQQKSNEPLLICGSFYLAGELRKLLNGS